MNEIRLSSELNEERKQDLVHDNWPYSSFSCKISNFLSMKLSAFYLALILDTAYKFTMHCSQGRHLSFFQGGGTILTDFLGGGQNMKQKKCCVQKHKKSQFFKIRGGKYPPPPKWRPWLLVKSGALFGAFTLCMWSIEICVTSLLLLLTS